MQYLKWGLGTIVQCVWVLLCSMFVHSLSYFFQFGFGTNRPYRTNLILHLEQMVFVCSPFLRKPLATFWVVREHWGWGRHTEGGTIPCMLSLHLAVYVHVPSTLQVSQRVKRSGIRLLWCSFLWLYQHWHCPAMTQVRDFYWRKPWHGTEGD